MAARPGSEAAPCSWRDPFRAEGSRRHPGRSGRKREAHLRQSAGRWTWPVLRWWGAVIPFDTRVWCWMAASWRSVQTDNKPPGAGGGPPGSGPRGVVFCRWGRGSIHLTSQEGGDVQVVLQVGEVGAVASLLGGAEGDGPGLPLAQEGRFGPGRRRRGLRIEA